MLRHHLALLPSEIPWRRDRDRQVFRVEARSDDGWFEIIAVNAGKQVDVYSVLGTELPHMPNSRAAAGRIRHLLVAGWPRCFR